MRNKAGADAGATIGSSSPTVAWHGKFNVVENTFRVDFRGEMEGCIAHPEINSTFVLKCLSIICEIKYRCAVSN